MKKSYLIIVLLFSAFSLLLTSCDKDPDELSVPDQLSGSYKLYINDDLIVEGTSGQVGMYENIVTITPSEDLSIILSEVPEKTGAVMPIDGSNRTVIISGNNLTLSDGSDEMYFSNSGSMKRASATKITFEGVCSDMLGTTYTFKGEVESSVFSAI